MALLPALWRSLPKQVQASSSATVVGLVIVSLWSIAACCTLSKEKGFQAFVRVADGKFVDGACSEVFPLGWNSWAYPLLKASVNAAAGSKQGAALVDAAFTTATSAGFNTFRLFAHGVDTDLVLQPTPGTYNESVWRGLDYLLHAAAKFQIWVVISPATNWQTADSKWAYVWWAGLNVSTADDFWTTSTARKLYRNHLTALVNRVNHITGVAYKDDPVIFAWNLFNEVRCDSPGRACHWDVVKWTDEMARHIKSMDSNHMVSCGSEGFFGVGSGSVFANPYGYTFKASLTAVPQSWSSATGQDVFAMQSLDAIDYVTVHVWPDNWSTINFQWATVFIAAQQMVAARLGKPMVIEEFGKQVDKPSEVVSVKNPWFDFFYNALLASYSYNAPLKGLLFWSWEPVDVTTVPEVDRDRMAVYTGDETWTSIVKWIQIFNNRRNNTVNHN